MTSSASLVPEIDDRIDRVERCIEAQKEFIHRVPDPDTRERAIAHLIELIDMCERLRESKIGSASQ